MNNEKRRVFHVNFELHPDMHEALMEMLKGEDLTPEQWMAQIVMTEMVKLKSEGTQVDSGGTLSWDFTLRQDLNEKLKKVAASRGYEVSGYIARLVMNALDEDSELRSSAHRIGPVDKEKAMEVLCRIAKRVLDDVAGETLSHESLKLLAKFVVCQLEYRPNDLELLYQEVWLRHWQGEL